MSVVIPDEAVKPFNQLAREQMKFRLLKDIRMDLTICDLEGWDKMEYLNELRTLINEIRNAIQNP